MEPLDSFHLIRIRTAIPCSPLLAALVAICFIVPTASSADGPTSETVGGVNITVPVGWVARGKDPNQRIFKPVEAESKETSIKLVVTDREAESTEEFRRTFDSINDISLKDFKVIEPGGFGEQKMNQHVDMIHKSSVVDGPAGKPAYFDVVTLQTAKKLAVFVFYSGTAEDYTKHRPAFEGMLVSAAGNQTKAPAPPTDPDPDTDAASGASIQSPEQSKLVTRNPDGTLGVAEKSGKPIDGIKLSMHNIEIRSPNIAVASDGTIHVAFIEQNSDNFQFFVYHRSSRDSGKTWSESTNVSEDMPGWLVGNCKLLVDGRNRTYVIWRTGLAAGFQAPTEEYAGDQANNHSNLVYRVLEGGKWSNTLPVNAPATRGDSDNGPLQWFPGIDHNGHAQVIWNASPDGIHPELKQNGIHIQAIYPGVIWQASLDGATPAKAKPIYEAPVTINPLDPNRGQICDGFGVMTAYFDKNGTHHILAAVENAEGERSHPVFQLVEDGKQSAALDGTGQSTEVFRNPPVILIDARGIRHAIAIQLGGEQPQVRDYLPGSSEKPKIVRSAGNAVSGMQAFQATGGRMVVLMQMNDTGTQGETNNFVSISDGGEWSTPVDLTNNAARNTITSKDIGLISNSTVLYHYDAGPAAGAYDRDGHLVVLMLNTERALGTFTTGRWVLNNGSSNPALQFLRL